MRKAFLHRKAEEDAREIALYIAEDNPEAADTFRVALERIREMLADLLRMRLALESRSLCLLCYPLGRFGSTAPSL
jgi:plasmid stabilization system protein ParE